MVDADAALFGYVAAAFMQVVFLIIEHVFLTINDVIQVIALLSQAKAGIGKGGYCEAVTGFLAARGYVHDGF
ncbi:hypothetical protein PAECIP111893_03986 [Paenibacillus plantiphilus]|uniref:Uncharacterized protein n=1 Tax=Paenibacillus plantiphilus TaxID=2905650 RepID=A0ABM9CLQ5_9BACL|nr:hypothetical protein [Paenibacillus plantiphilus]CAH1215616.1 hypothetical protein PAECIP111893_03986 [Paenibacillus plantiphilus]